MEGKRPYQGRKYNYAAIAEIYRDHPTAANRLVARLYHERTNERITKDMVGDIVRRYPALRRGDMSKVKLGRGGRPRKYNYELVRSIITDDPSLTLEAIAAIYAERARQEIKQGALSKLFSAHPELDVRVMTRGRPRRYDYELIAFLFRDDRRRRNDLTLVCDLYRQRTGVEIPLVSLEWILKNNPHLRDGIYPEDGQDG